MNWVNKFAISFICEMQHIKTLALNLMLVQCTWPGKPWVLDTLKFSAHALDLSHSTHKSKYAHLLTFTQQTSKSTSHLLDTVTTLIGQ